LKGIVLLEVTLGLEVENTFLLSSWGCKIFPFSILFSRWLYNQPDHQAWCSSILLSGQGNELSYNHVCTLCFHHFMQLIILRGPTRLSLLYVRVCMWEGSRFLHSTETLHVTRSVSVLGFCFCPFLLLNFTIFFF